MMKQLTDFEIKRAAALKAYRTAIRLKHALAADAEIAATLPEIEERINNALAMGQNIELTPGEVFSEV